MQIKVNRINIAYDMQGIGLPLVLLHAFPLNRTMWQPQIPELSKKYQVITPDFRGFGDSQRTSLSAQAGKPYPFEALADDVHALMQKLGIPKFVLGGLSMGGYVAFAFYRNHPEMVQALILADTRAEADTDEGKKNRKALADQAIKEGARVIADQLTPKLLGKTTLAKKPRLVQEVKEIISSTSIAGIANASLGMAFREDSTALLSTINCPTLILVGEEDVLTPVPLSENLHRQIKKSQMVLIPEAGHLANLENPKAFNRSVLSFLKSL
ncbi:MAG TPA: alpha/beta hydrolase [bacterium]